MGENFKFKILLLENSLGSAIYQGYNGKYVPLTTYYYWPRTDAWKQVLLDLETKSWISQREKKFILNKTTDILNQWQNSPKQPHLIEDAVLDKMVEFIGEV